MLAPSRVRCSGESRVPAIRRRVVFGRRRRQRAQRSSGSSSSLDQVDNFSATGSSATGTGRLPIRRCTTKRTFGCVRAHTYMRRGSGRRSSDIRELNKIPRTHTQRSHLGEHWLLSIADGSSLTCWPNAKQSSTT